MGNKEDFFPNILNAKRDLCSQIVYTKNFCKPLWCEWRLLFNRIISVKISSFISNIIYLLLDVSTQQWCLHQEFFKHYRNWHNFSNCHYENATNRTCTGNLRNWCYDFPFFWTIFRMLGLNSFQHWLISIPFSRFIICVGSIALMIRASLIFLFFQSSSFSRYTTSCHLMEWVLCVSKCTKKAFVFFPFFTSFWCWYFLLSIFCRLTNVPFFTVCTIKFIDSVLLLHPWDLLLQVTNCSFDCVSFFGDHSYIESSQFFLQIFRETLDVWDM